MTVTDPQYNEAHTYGHDDPIYRLTLAVVTGGPVNYNESYGYNTTTGNRQTKGSLTLAYNDVNHVHAVTGMGGNTYGYDANGNQTTRNIGGSTFTLGYDAENRLVSVSGPSLSAQFTYDGDGRRVKSVINGSTTVFVGNYYEVAGGVVNKYYFAGGSRVAMRQNGTLYYLLSDHLGSTSLTTDANGVKLAGLRYNALGTVRDADGATPFYPSDTFPHKPQRLGTPGQVRSRKQKPPHLFIDEFFLLDEAVMMAERDLDDPGVRDQAAEAINGFFLKLKPFGVYEFDHLGDLIDGHQIG